MGRLGHSETLANLVPLDKKDLKATPDLQEIPVSLDWMARKVLSEIRDNGAFQETTDSLANPDNLANRDLQDSQETRETQAFPEILGLRDLLVREDQLETSVDLVFKLMEFRERQELPVSVDSLAHKDHKDLPDNPDSKANKGQQGRMECWGRKDLWDNKANLDREGSMELMDSAES